jgi:hypothetical protein
VELAKGADLVYKPKNVTRKRRGGTRHIQGHLFAADEHDEDDGASFFSLDGLQSPSKQEEFKFEGEEEEGRESLHPELPTSSTTKAETLKDIGTRLFEYVIENKEKFGVDPRGKVLSSTGMPITNSNARDSIGRLLYRDISNFPSPPGTSALEGRLRKDPTAKEIIMSAKNITTPKREAGNQSKGRTRSHVGFGLLKQKKRIPKSKTKEKTSKSTKKKRKTCLFKPKKWC